MDKDLVKKAKNGNVDAFETLIIYYKNDLYKIAKTRLSQIDDIEDAVQETIISAYQYIHKLINTSKFKSWLFTILINKCNQIYNKKNNHTISYDSIDGEKYLTEFSEIDSSLEFDDLLSMLDNDEKTILVLYYSEKYTSREISKILKIKDSTIRTKISRAKKKIEKKLKEENKYGQYR